MDFPAAHGHKLGFPYIKVIHLAPFTCGEGESPEGDRVIVRHEICMKTLQALQVSFACGLKGGERQERATVQPHWGPQHLATRR